MSKAKILLLEDDANLNETITDFLEDEGYTIESTYDGYEAQDRLYESRYDLLLLDVNTPGIDGFTLPDTRHERMGWLSPNKFYHPTLDGSWDDSGNTGVHKKRAGGINPYPSREKPLWGGPTQRRPCGRHREVAEKHLLRRSKTRDPHKQRGAHPTIPHHPNTTAKSG